MIKRISMAVVGVAVLVFMAGCGADNQTPTSPPLPPAAIPTSTAVPPTATSIPTIVPPMATSTPTITPPTATPTANTPHPAQEALMQGQERWEQYGLTDYAYTGAWTCFCPEEYRADTQVTVDDGEVTAVTSADPNVETIPAPERFVSIEGLFALIQEAISRNAASIEVSYDETYGHPVELFIDYDERMADEEDRFTISSFTTANDLDPAQEALLQAQERWDQSGIVHYAYTGAWTCFCPEEYRADTQVTVGGGEVTAVTSADPDVETIPDPERFVPIEGLFALIQDAISRNAASIEVAYDDTHGYPMELFIDYDERMADEEDRFTMSSFTTAYDLDPAHEALLQAWERWGQSGIVHYAYTGAWTCFCPEEYRADTQVTVDGGKVTAVTSADPNVETIPDPERFVLIEGLFALIQDAISRNAASIEVSYDETYGYPAEIFIDYDERRTDEEDRFTISSFTPR